MNSNVENLPTAVLIRNVLATICCAQITPSRPIRLIAKLAIAALILKAVTSVCFAQTYPSKLIRLIAPSFPGTAPDIRARWIAEKLHSVLGQALIVDNKGAPRAPSEHGRHCCSPPTVIRCFWYIRVPSRSIRTSFQRCPTTRSKISYP